LDPVTGTWGKVLLDPINSTENTTLARLNTLGSLIAAFATVADDGWRADFLKAATPVGGATPGDTLAATAGIAGAPWANAGALYALFDRVYPQPISGFTGMGIDGIGWGTGVTEDKVWVTGFNGAIGVMAGDDTKGHPGGTKTGDAVHVFQNGSIQMVTDVSIDPAGTVWVANNWNNLDAVGDADPARATSTWGGGTGIVTIYGPAAPVKTPLIGPSRAF